MEGDGLLHPRGPLPPTVYWRRRLIVLGVALLVLVFVANQCAGGPGKKNNAGKKASAKPTASVSATTKPPKSSVSTRPAPSSTSSSKAPATATSPAASAETSSSSKPPAADPAKQCVPPALQISVKTDAADYAAAGIPVITMTIKNAGTTPCTRDLGAAATELRITSGADRIWSSDDCNKGGAPKNTVLKAGEARTLTVSWNRKRSKSGADCVGAAALPGRYRVVGRLGNLSTLPYSFGLS